MSAGVSLLFPAFFGALLSRGRAIGVNLRLLSVKVFLSDLTFVYLGTVLTFTSYALYLEPSLGP